MRSNPITNKVVRGSLIGTTAALLALILWFFGVVETWEAKTWDWRTRLMASPNRAANEICLILLDQQSLDWAEEVNGLTWPWPREIYGAIVEFCKRNGAKAIAFDVLFTEDSKYGVEDDEAFGGALAGFKNAVVPVFLSNSSGAASRWPAGLQEPIFQIQPPDPRIDGEKGRVPAFSKATFPIDSLARNAAVLGTVGLRPDSDGIYRRFGLLSGFDNRTVPSLGLALYLAANPGTSLTLGPDSVMVGNKKVPVDQEGSVLLRYRGPSGVHQTYSAAAVLQSEIQIRNGEKPNIDDPKAFAGKLVLFGFSAPGLYDLRPSPTSGVYPGVEIHATFLDNLVSEDFIRSTPNWVVATFILILAIACTFTMTWVKTIPGSVGAFAAFFSLPFLSALGGYHWGYRVPVVAPGVSIVLATGMTLLVNYTTEGRQKRFIKSAFNHFLSPAVIDQLIEDPRRLTLGGERKLLTIFFSDLQGFTSISEKLEPESLIQLLNDYLTEMTNIVHEEGGTIDKYEGDAIIAFWNAPLSVPDHALRAVTAALRCQQRLETLRPVFKDRAGAELLMRIGINTGAAVVGNLGSDTRFDYTMIGDAVNLAARLEGANKQFGTYTMISQTTYDLVQDTIRARELARLTVVGKKETVTVYEPMTTDAYEKKKSVLKKFNLGLKAFYDGEMDSSEKLFSKIEKIDPGARSYARKCRSLSTEKLVNWQGQWVMTSK